MSSLLERLDEGRTVPRAGEEGGVTERELFAAYRKADAYEAECACGDLIAAASSDLVEQAVALHSESTVHTQWREWQKAVLALKRPARKPCPCHGEAA